MICRPHQCVVVYGQIRRHLQLHHQIDGQNIKEAVRAARAYFAEHEECIQCLRDLQVPTGPIPAISGLAIHRKSFQCQAPGCGWVGGNIHRIQEHCRIQHSWVNPDQRKRPIMSGPWTQVASQQFTPQGPNSQHFAVILPRPAIESPGESTREDTDETTADTTGVGPAPPSQDDAAFPVVPEASSHDPVVEQYGPTFLSPAAIRLIGALVDWQRDCSLCRVHRISARKRRHRLEDCRNQDDARSVQEECQRIRAGMGPPPPLTCPVCLLPAMVCRRYHVEGDAWTRQEGIWCQFPDVVLPAVVSIMFFDPKVYDSVILPRMRQDRVNIFKPDEVYCWFGKEVTWDGSTSNQISCLFYQIACHPDQNSVC